MSFRVILIALCSTILVGCTLASPAQAALPAKSRWLADVHQAMSGSQAYVHRRVARGGKLAVNLDIDNTALASHYDHRKAVRVVLRFAKRARQQGVAVLFNTGRITRHLDKARRELRRAGYPVTEICGRANNRQRLSVGKQHCRRHFERQGFTIIANVGNRRSDFLGGHYEKAFRLPNYHNQLA
jgi:predicted secreted acid phosphatase